MTSARLVKVAATCGMSTGPEVPASTTGPSPSDRGGPPHSS